MRPFSPAPFLSTLFLLSASVALATDAHPAGIAPFFAPPAEFAGQFGHYKSPLKFYDGTPVASPADWPARRAEILKYWHGQMGPWPALLTRPRLELSEKETRDGGVTQYRVNVEVAEGVMQHGFLLIPRGDSPRPAVFVPYYHPEVSVAYQGPLHGPVKKTIESGRGKDRDYALQLARRGFVTLSIGAPEGNAYRFGGTSCQRLSYLAYIAANCHTALAQRPEVDPARIGVIGHSYGGKWAMFASCLYDKFAAGVWSDGGVVFDESRGNVNYWSPWYLGYDPKLETQRKRGMVKPENPRTGAYKTIFESGHDLHELHALMAPRPFLVSGGSEDFPARWIALNHAVAVNEFLGFKNRVAMTNRPEHRPNPEANEQAYTFFEFTLRPGAAPTR